MVAVAVAAVSKILLLLLLSAAVTNINLIHLATMNQYFISPPRFVMPPIGGIHPL
jgi:hypothetical protein